MDREELVTTKRLVNGGNPVSPSGLCDSYDVWWLVCHLDNDRRFNWDPNLRVRLVEMGPEKTTRSRLGLATDDHLSHQEKDGHFFDLKTAG